MYRSHRPPAEVDPMGIPYPIIPTAEQDDTSADLGVNKHHHYHSKRHFTEEFDRRALRASKVQFVPMSDHNGNFHNKVSGLPVELIPSTRGKIFQDVLFNYCGYMPSHGYDVSGPYAYIRQMSKDERELIRSSIVAENLLVSSRDLSLHGRVADFILATLVYSDLLNDDQVEEILGLARTHQSASFLDRKIKPFLTQIVGEGCADIQPEYLRAKKSGAIDRHRSTGTLASACVHALVNTYQRPGQLETAFLYMVNRRQSGLESLTTVEAEPPQAISKNGAVMLLSGLQTSARGHQVARA